MASTEHYDILIIDDDVDLNALLTEYLQGFGHTLRSATTAVAGRDQLRRELPDLLLLDVMLPDTNGLDLCREFRAEYDLPVIMLTARGETRVSRGVRPAGHHADRARGDGRQSHGARTRRR